MSEVVELKLENGTHVTSEGVELTFVNGIHHDEGDDADDDDDDPNANQQQEPTFLAKDGKYYASYMEQRAANIRHNEAVLKSVGLDQSFSLRNELKRRKVSITTTTTTTTSTHSPELRRHSNRIRKKAPVMLWQEESSPPIFKKLIRKRKLVSRASNGTSQTSLTYDDRQRLTAYETSAPTQWINDMAAYLLEVENLSPRNQRGVMRQVEKLVFGRGITYHHWKTDSNQEDVYFCRDRLISLSDDMEVLYEQACECEHKHGRDLGNGTYNKALHRVHTRFFSYFI
jgi:hypothetical protein